MRNMLRVGRWIVTFLVMVSCVSAYLNETDTRLKSWYRFDEAAGPYYNYMNASQKLLTRNSGTISRVDGIAFNSTYAMKIGNYGLAVANRGWVWENLTYSIQVPDSDNDGLMSEPITMGMFIKFEFETGNLPVWLDAYGVDGFYSNHDEVHFKNGGASGSASTNFSGVPLYPAIVGFMYNLTHLCSIVNGVYSHCTAYTDGYNEDPTIPFSVMGNGNASGWQMNFTVDDLFVYNVSLSAAELISLYNQTIPAAPPDTVVLDNCTSGTYKTLNITYLNATSNSTIQVDADYKVYYNDTPTTYKNYSVANILNGEQFCLNTNAVTYSDLDIYYSAGDYQYEYHLLDSFLSNVTQYLTLYTQDSTSKVVFTVRNTYGIPLPNAYVKILKYDLGTNSYSTMEVLRTNSEGQAYGNIVLYTTYYQFIVEYLGTVYLITEPERLFDVTRTLEVDLTGGEDYYDSAIIAQGVYTNISFTNSTGNFKFIWSDPSNLMHEACLEVKRRNVTSESILCNNCTASPAGTLLCNIGTETPGTLYTAVGYLQFGNREGMATTSHETPSERYYRYYDKFKDNQQKRDYGIYLGALITAAGGLGFMFSPVTGIVGTVVGLYASYMIGFIQLSYVGLISIIILAIFALWRLERK